MSWHVAIGRMESDKESKLGGYTTFRAKEIHSKADGHSEMEQETRDKQNTTKRQTETSDVCRKFARKKSFSLVSSVSALELNKRLQKSKCPP